MYAALQSGEGNSTTSASTMLQMEKACDGNLCRCTGYRPLLDVAKTLGSDFVSAEPSEVAAAGVICSGSSDKLLSHFASFDSIHVGQETPGLLQLGRLSSTSLDIVSAPGSVLPDGSLGQQRWLRPTTLDDLLALRQVRCVPYRSSSGHIAALLMERACLLGRAGAPGRAHCWR